MNSSKFIVENPDPDTYKIPADWKPYSISFLVTNTSDKEVTAIRYESIVFDNNGISIGGSIGYSADLSVQPGGSYYFYAKEGRLPPFTSAGNYDDLKAICNFRLMSCKKYDLGTYSVPLTVNDLIDQIKDFGLEVFRSPINIRIYSAGEPDGNGFVSLYLQCAVSIKDKLSFENIEFRAKLLEKNGNETEEFIFSHELLPDSVVFANEHSGVKISKIKNAKVNISVNVYEEVVCDRIEILSRRETAEDNVFE